MNVGGRLPLKAMIHHDLSGARKHSTGQCRGDSWGVVIFREIWDLFISMIYFVDFFKQAQDDYLIIIFEYWTATVHLTLQSSAETYCNWKCWNFSIFAKEAAMAMRRVGNCPEFIGLLHVVLDMSLRVTTSSMMKQWCEIWANLTRELWKKVTIDPKPVWIPTENQPYQLLHRSMSKILSIFV